MNPTIHHISQPPSNKMAEDNSAAWPQADQALSQEILDLVQQATHYRKRCANRM